MRRFLVRLLKAIIINVHTDITTLRDMVAHPCPITTDRPHMFTRISGLDFSMGAVGVVEVMGMAGDTGAEVMAAVMDMAVDTGVEVRSIAAGEAGRATE